MEDQQPDPDDLTAEQPHGDKPTVAADAGVSIGVRRRRRPLDNAPRGKRRRRLRDTSVSVAAVLAKEAGAGDPDGKADATTGLTNLDDGGPATVTGRFDRWRTVLVAVAAVVFVGSVAYAGTALHTYLGDRAAASTRTEVARTAVAAVTTLWTYTPESIDTLADRASEYLSGDFSAQYRKFLDAAVAPNKQAQVTDSTEVVGAGVESVNGTDAVAIVFTNTTATSPLTKSIPSLKYVGYRLAMKREGPRWLVTSMSTVSFLDLTPQL